MNGWMDRWMGLRLAYGSISTGYAVRKGKSDSSVILTVQKSDAL